MKLYTRTTWVNWARSFRTDEEDEPQATDYTSVHALYRAMRKEHGRCTRGLHRRLPGGRSVKCGWVFEKRERYEDTGEAYTRETWIGVFVEQEDGTLVPLGATGRIARRGTMNDEQNEEPTMVIFRMWLHQPQSVIALFPEMPAGYTDRYCLSYQHIGQHGDADALEIISASRPATSEEYAALKSELESDPYNYRLIVRKRLTGAMGKKRRAEARRLREA